MAEGPPTNLRPASDRLRIEVDDRARALAVVASMQGVELDEDEEGEVAGGGSRLRLRLSAPVTAAAVNARLVTGGVAVHALVPEHERLEDVFVSLVEGADVPR